MAASTDEEFKLIKELMPLVSAETLRDFLLRYAKEHPEFKAAWRDWLKAQFMPQGTTPDDIRTSVRALFNTAAIEPVRGRKWYDDYQDWRELEEPVLRLIECLQGLPLDSRLAFAFEFLRQLDAHSGLDIHEASWEEMEKPGCLACGMVRDFIASEDVSDADKRAALEELADIAALPLYRQVGLFNLDAMFLELRIAAALP